MSYPTTAMKEAGTLIESYVSQPKASGEKPAVSAMAEPPEEPHGCFISVS